jgi:hypothetical protein
MNIFGQCRAGGGDSMVTVETPTAGCVTSTEAGRTVHPLIRSPNPRRSSSILSHILCPLHLGEGTR